jgi:integrase
MSGTEYMCKNRHGTYYARFIIPKQLQEHFNNKKEIRRSLQTDSRKLAVKRARIYRVEFESIVDKLMSKADNTAERARRIVDSLFTDKTKLEEEATEQFAAQIRNDAAKFDNDDLSKTQFITFFDELGKLVTVDTGNDEKDAELYHLIKPTLNDVELAQREKRANELHQAQLAAIAAQVPVSTQPINPKKLSEYLVDYIKYQTNPNNKEGEGWGSNTQTVKVRLLNVFVERCDKPAAAFSWDDAQRYIKIAQTIPPYFTNKDHAKKFAGLTLEKLLDDSIDTSEFKPRKSSAVSIDIRTARAFIEWIRTNKRVKGLQDAVEAFDQATKKIDKTSDRRAFTSEELKILFEDDNPARENYVKGFNSRRGIDATLRYWLPLLGLYTGATIAELCQLHLSDIRQHKAFDGSEHWVIDFNNEGDKRLKNKYRARLIPVHKVLFGLGFIDHVQALDAKGETKLFPTAKRYEGKHGEESFSVESQWWGEYSDNAGIADKNVVFHSFKHTQDTYLDKIHCDRDIVAAFSGHSIPAIGKQVYSKGGHRVKDIGPLVEWSNKIDYGLTHHPFKDIS